MNHTQNFNEIKSKAKAIVAKHKEVKEENTNIQQKKINVKIKADLPALIADERNEQVIGKYMDVLRETHLKIGKALVGERVKQKRKEKLEKALKNPNIVKRKLERNKNKHQLRKKIKQMRRTGIFPQPKSYMNYRNRNGLLKKNSIKIK